MRAKPAIALASIAGALALAAPAPAATEMGDLTTAPSTTCDTNSLIWMTSAPYVVTAKGVITELRGASGNAPAKFSVKVVRPVPLSILGTTPEQSLTAAGTVNVPVRIPVQAGDSLGLHTGSLVYSCGRAGTPSDTYKQRIAVSDLGVGPIAGMVVSNAGVRLSIGAKVEPDVNNDGYGDETQQCKVPDLKKLTKSKARAALLNAKCVLGTTKKKRIKKFTKKNKRNRVRSQSVKAGSMLPIGATVNITINVKKPKKK